MNETEHDEQTEQAPTVWGGEVYYGVKLDATGRVVCADETDEYDF